MPREDREARAKEVLGTEDVKKARPWGAGAKLTVRYYRGQYFLTNVEKRDKLHTPKGGGVVSHTPRD